MSIATTPTTLPVTTTLPAQEGDRIIIRVGHLVFVTEWDPWGELYALDWEGIEWEILGYAK